MTLIPPFCPRSRPLACRSPFRCAPARARPAIKIGVLNDQSGPYANTGGITSVICAKQALEDFGVSAKGMNVEVISADHQNKPDLAVSIARQWFDRDGVDVIWMCRHRRWRWRCSRSCGRRTRSTSTSGARRRR